VCRSALYPATGNIFGEYMASTDLLDREPLTIQSVQSLVFVYSKQTRLVALADQKASFLMSMLAIGLTLLMSNISSLMELDAMTQACFAAMAVTQLAAIFLAVWTVIPRVRGSDRRFNSVGDMSNPFFFMLLPSIDEDVYVDGIVDRLGDPDEIARMVISDFYQIGIGLTVKYRVLRSAYITAAISFLLAALGLAQLIVAS